MAPETQDLPAMHPVFEALLVRTCGGDVDAPRALWRWVAEREAALTAPDLWWEDANPECGYPSAGELLACTEADPGAVIAVTTGRTLGPCWVAALPTVAERDGDLWGYYEPEAVVFPTEAAARAAVTERQQALRTAYREEPDA